MKLRYEHAPYGRPGFRLTLQPFGRGGGYRAFDFPWYQKLWTQRAPWYRRRPWFAYLPGVTITVATRQHRMHPYTRKVRRFVWVNVTTKGNAKYLPSWW